MSEFGWTPWQGRLIVCIIQPDGSVICSDDCNLTFDYFEYHNNLQALKNEANWNIDLEYADSIEYLFLDRFDIRLIYKSNYSSGTLVSYEWLNEIVELGELYRINKNTLCNCITDGEYYEFVFWSILEDGTPGAFHGALLTESFHDPSEFSDIVPGDKMEKVLQIDGTALLQVECCFSNQLETKHICKAGIVTIEWKKDRNGDYYVTKCSYKDDNDIRSLYNIFLKSDNPPR
jgi:hypothetical protein